MAGHAEQQLDNYRLVRFLGAGSFGAVYLGEHVYHKTPVAIKVLPQLDNDDLPTFLNEARTFRLRHPNIVQVLDFGVEKDSHTPFLVMEYAPNGSLRQHYPQGTQLPLPTIVTYVRQIASALQYAHDERLIHRDVKPANMLLGSHHEVLLSDFGAALIAHSSFFRITQNVVGTGVYMAPEQLLGKPCFASDQYALGTVVYEWLCGDTPFHGSFFELYNLHLHAPPPSLRTRMPMVSLDVEQVVMRALAKDPQQRFPGVQAFAEALERCSQSVSPKLFLPPVPVLQPASTPQETEAVFLPRVLPATVAVSPHRATPPKPGISRRTFIRIGAGLGLVAAGGSIAYLVANVLGSMEAQQSTNISTPTPVPTTTPLVTTILTYQGHSDYVLAVAWSPDGKYIASAGGDQYQQASDTTVQIWDARTGKLFYKYSGHTAVVRSVAWSPDKEAQTIVSSDDDGRVKVWSPHSGEIYTYTGHSLRVQSVAWSPDGKSIASASFDKTVQVWDAATGGQNFTQIYNGHSMKVYAVAWSPDGKYIAFAGEDQKVQIWDASNVNNILHVFQHNSLVGAVAWSPDSKYVVSGDDNPDDAVRVWNITTGENTPTYRGKPGQQVYSVAWSPNGKYIISGSQDQTVQIWDASKESHIYTYSRHTGQVQAVAWSPDGALIASGGFDKTIQIWTAPTVRS